MAPKTYSNAIGFDDAPFAPDQQDPVPIIGAVFAQTRFDGVLVSQIDRDGDDATSCIINLIRDSKFREHIQLVMLQGITFAGFNVVDPFEIFDVLNVPVIVVCRREPDFESIRETLLTNIPRGDEKWKIIERMAPMESIDKCWIQRVGISREDAQSTLEQLTLYGQMPEPIRVAHLIASALNTGQSKGRA